MVRHFKEHDIPDKVVIGIYATKYDRMGFL